MTTCLAASSTLVPAVSASSPAKRRLGGAQRIRNHARRARRGRAPARIAPSSRSAAPGRRRRTPSAIHPVPRAQKKSRPSFLVHAALPAASPAARSQARLPGGPLRCRARETSEARTKNASGMSAYWAGAWRRNSGVPRRRIPARSPVARPRSSAAPATSRATVPAAKRKAASAGMAGDPGEVPGQTRATAPGRRRGYSGLDHPRRGDRAWTHHSPPRARNLALRFHTAQASQEPSGDRIVAARKSAAAHRASPAKTAASTGGVGAGAVRPACGGTAGASARPRARRRGRIARAAKRIDSRTA